MEHLHTLAVTHTREMIDHSLLHSDGEGLVLYDTDHPLTTILTEAYRVSFPKATFVDIADHDHESLLALLQLQPAGNLVVMIQSSNFRLNEFRIRIFLFNQGLKVVEHMHLNRLSEDQWETYINALHYDPQYYHPLGHGIKQALATAKRTEVHCAGTVLTYDTPFEAAKLNIGDYREMNNIGGTFPIGEVFTEAVDLSKVNGEARIFAFAGLDHHVKIYEPFRIQVREGILSATEETPQDFLDILAMIEETEPVHVREFGLGLNPAISKDHLLNDITSFERIKGLHLSLGGKHAIYKKPQFKKNRTRYHIDVFIAAERILLDGTPIYQDGNYLLQV